MSGKLRIFFMHVRCGWPMKPRGKKRSSRKDFPNQELIRYHLRMSQKKLIYYFKETLFKTSNIISAQYRNYRYFFNLILLTLINVRLASLSVKYGSGVNGGVSNTVVCCGVLYLNNIHFEESSTWKTCILRSPVPETHDSSAGRPAPLLPAASRAQPRPSKSRPLLQWIRVNDSWEFNRAESR